MAARALLKRMGKSECRITSADWIGRAIGPVVEHLEQRRLLAAIAWDGGGDGVHWGDANNWTGNTLPGAADDATINVAANPTVILDTAETVHSLNTAELLNISGSLEAGTLSFSAAVTLDGSGRLFDTTATASGGAKLVVTNGTLSNVALTGTVDVSNGWVYVERNLVVNGTFQLGSLATGTSGYASFTGTQTFSGSGTILLNNGTIAGETAADVTIGAGLTIRGKSGNISPNGGRIIAQGNLQSDFAAGQISASPGFLSSGNVSASNGATLLLDGFQNAAGCSLSATIAGTLVMQGDWSNLGTIALNNATLQLGGSFTQASMGAFSRTGGTVKLTGTASGDLTLNTATGSWVLANGGTVKDSVLNQLNGAKLVVEDGKFDRVTIQQNLDLSSGTLRVSNGLTLNAQMTMGDLVLDTWGSLSFEGTSFSSDTPAQTVGGTGTILANNASIVNDMSGATDEMTGLPFNATLQIDSGITIRGKNANIRADYWRPESRIVNAGVISADLNNGQFDIGTAFSSTGTLQAINGATLSLTDFHNAAGETVSATNASLYMRGSWRNDGVIAVSNSTLHMAGEFTQAALGTVNRTGGTMSLDGVLSGGLTLNAATGTWVMNGGTLKGGPFTMVDGETLTLNSGTLDGITLASDWTLTSGTVNVRNGLTVNAVLTLGDVVNDTAVAVKFSGSQVPGQLLSGGGRIQAMYAWVENEMTGEIDPDSGLTLPAVLTIGADFSIHGKTLYLYNSYGINEAQILNLGTISADVPGGAFDFGSRFESTGTLEVRNGATLLLTDFTNAAGETLAPVDSTLVLRGQWHNLGSIALEESSTLKLQGEFLQADLGDFTRSNESTVSLEGVLSGGLALDAATGTWLLAGGTLRGGMLSLADDETLAFNSGSFDGLTLASDLRITSGSLLVYNGLTLNAVLSLGDPVNGQWTSLEFRGDGVAGQTISGTGLIHVDSGTLYSLMSGPIDPETGETLVATVTVATDLVVTGDCIVYKAWYLQYSRTNLEGLVRVERGRLSLDDESRLTGTLEVKRGAVLESAETLDLSQMQGMTVESGAQMRLRGGISGALPQGTALLHGVAAVASGFQTLEAWAPDGGAAAPHNPTLLENLTIEYGASVRLTNLADNEAGGGAEAIYVATLVVQENATLDLNGLHLYARNIVNHGSIIGGTVTQSPDAAPDALWLSGGTMAENVWDATVGTLGATDPDVSSTLTYSLVEGEGAQDNGHFWIENSVLKGWGGDFESDPTLSIRLRVTDEGGMYREQIFAVNVTDVNEAPTSISLSKLEVVEHTPAGTAVGNFNGVDPDSGDHLTFTLVGGDGSSGNAEFVIDANGVLKLANDVSLSAGSGYSIRVRATDSQGLYLEEVYQLAVVEQSLAPTDIQLTSSQVAENAWDVLVGAFSATDANQDETFTFSLLPDVEDNDNFWIWDNELWTNSEFDFEADNTYTVVVRVTDSTGLSYDKALAISITDVNESPYDLDIDANTIAETAPVGATVGHLHALDPDAGDTITYSLVAGPGDEDNAMFAISGNQLLTAGLLDYEQQEYYSIRLCATDASGLQTVGEFTIWVTDESDNAAPVALSASKTTNEDSASSGTVLATDVDGNALTYSVVAQPQHGTLVLQANGAFTYTPSGNCNGPDSFSFKANDGAADSNVATVSITVTAVNDAPVADTFSVGNLEDAPIAWSATGTDADNDTLTYSVVAQPAHGSLVLNADGTFNYTPAANYNGPDSFSFKANDGTIDSNTGIVNITVTAVNDAPVAAGQTITTNEDSASSGTVLATDVDGNALTCSVITQPQHGTLVLEANGAFTYTPSGNYNGPDSFTFKANDGVADSNTATVDLTIEPVNDAPVAAGHTISTNEDTAGSGTVSATDNDGDALTYSVVTQPQHGTVVLQANGAFTYTPNGNYSGPDSFAFKASDGVADSNTASVGINVVAVNDAPTGITLSKSSLNENLASGTVIGTLSGTDPDTGAVLTFSLPAGVGDNGSFRLENGQLKSNAVFNCEAKSSYLVTVRASDGKVTLDKRFTITVSNVNEKPAGLTLSKSSVAEHAVTGTVVGSFTGTDVDAANTFAYSLVSGTGSTDNAAFQIVGNQLKTRWPLDYEGKKSYAICVRVQDQGGLYYDKALAIGVTNTTESGAVPLTVTGKDTADVIALSMVSGKLRVASNGVNKDYDTAKISSITVNAGGGSDKVTIGAGVRAVKVTGAAGNDTLSGGDNVDTLDGGAGNDNLTGGAAINSLLGGSGTDVLRGGAGNDLLDGGSGTDALYGDDGDDVLVGGPGIVGAVLDNDVLSGGPGIDTADYALRSTALSLSLDGVANDGMSNEKDNLASDTENINGGSGADLIKGSSLANVLKGNGGNDSIYGGSGNDTLYGNAGVDKLYGDGDNDLLIPGAEGSKDTLTGGTGTDRYQQADLMDVRTDAMTLLA